MKTVENYRADMLTILGDAGGRRYTPTMLDMGLREALRVYRSFCPRKETVTQTVKAVDLGAFAGRKSPIKINPEKREGF